MKIQSIKVIAFLFLLFVSGVGLQAQGVLKGSETPGALTEAPVATITPSFRIVLPTSAVATDKFVADFSNLGLGSDAAAQMFFDENSCNLISFNVIPNSHKVEIYFSKYAGYNQAWAVSDWNTWLETRCENQQDCPCCAGNCSFVHWFSQGTNSGWKRLSPWKLG
jgi:hypothetical protein